MVFTDIHSERMIALEKEIAYFYGSPHPEKIADHYVQAIQYLEQNGEEKSQKSLKNIMLPPLKEAYGEVMAQTSLHFDIEKVASLEFDLILAQSQQAPFEKIYDIMVRLYQAVFHIDSISIHKAALLRTFLYQYKVKLLSQKHLSGDDIAFLKEIDKASKVELDKVVQQKPEKD